MDMRRNYFFEQWNSSDATTFRLCIQIALSSVRNHTSPWSFVSCSFVLAYTVFSKLFFQYCRSGLHIGWNVGYHDALWYQNYQTSSSITQCWDKMSVIVIVHLSVLILVTVYRFFQGSFSSFSKYCHRLTHCRINLISFSFAKVSKLLQQVLFI